jgi:hypothetical protein
VIGASRPPGAPRVGARAAARGTVAVTRRRSRASGAGARGRLAAAPPSSSGRPVPTLPGSRPPVSGRGPTVPRPCLRPAPVSWPAGPFSASCSSRSSRARAPRCCGTAWGARSRRSTRARRASCARSPRARSPSRSSPLVGLWTASVRPAIVGVARAFRESRDGHARAAAQADALERQNATLSPAAGAAPRAGRGARGDQRHARRAARRARTARRGAAPGAGADRGHRARGARRDRRLRHAGALHGLEPGHGAALRRPPRRRSSARRRPSAFPTSPRRPSARRTPPRWPARSSCSAPAVSRSITRGAARPTCAGWTPRTRRCAPATGA